VVFPPYLPKLPSHLWKFFGHLQGIGGGPEVTAGVYLAVGVTASVDERVGRGVGEEIGCEVGVG
jgi:hypothetical protein